jgi:hypothetical protein
MRLVVASFFAPLAWWSWTNHLWPMFSVLAQGTPHVTRMEDGKCHQPFNCADLICSFGNIHFGG